MNKKKIIYIGVLIVIAAIVSIASFSYAFLTRVDEQHGKLNIVAGTLEYKIESDDLNNNSITLSANESKEIEITIKSLNKIDSKYQLYTNNVENVDIRYTDEEDEGVGTIESNGTKKVKVVLENNSNSSKTITFGVQGGFEDNSITLEDNRVAVELGDGLCISGKVYEFDYTGDVQEFTTKCAGLYKLEVWGAQGGNYTEGTGAQGGKGGYTKGNYILNKDDKVYVVVGGQGESPILNSSTPAAGGYNGGGNGGNTLEYSQYNWYIGGAGGGGATHISKTNTILKDTSVSNLLLAAGAGGGAGANSGSSVKEYNNGGYGGGTTGGSGTGTMHTSYSGIYPGGGGTQTAGGSSGSGLSGRNFGGYGYGGANNYTGSAVEGGGGGAGYYGGGAGQNYGASGGGGSAYIGGVTNGTTIAGNASMPTHDGTSTMTGNIGNGYARITYIDGNLEPPTLTGGTGTDTWGSTAPVITISKAGKASSGVKNYEYYTSTSSTAPTDSTEATGTLSSPYSLEITTKGTTYVYYRTVSNNDIKSSWSSPEVVNLDVKLIPNYGTSIPSSISNLYYTIDGATYAKATVGSIVGTDGNYNQTKHFLAVDPNYNLLFYKRNTYGDGTKITSVGTNTMTLSSAVTNTWIGLDFTGGYTVPNPKIIGSIKLIFSNGQSYTIQQAVSNGYIEPLVLYYGGSSNTSSINMAATINGGNTTSGDYICAYYVFKVKNVSALKQISFYTNTAWNSGNWYAVYGETSNVDFSLSPFTVQYKY